MAATGSGLVSLDLDRPGQPRELEGRSVSAIAPASWTRLWSVVDRREIWRGGGAAAIKTPAQATERVQLFEATGCDELIMFMTAPAVEQVERLARAVL